MRQALLQEARDPNTSAERLRSLATGERAVQLAVAQNPSAPPDVLEQLSAEEDDALRSLLAQNPSTPPKILYAMCGQFPQQIVANPVFSLLFLENPSFIERISERGFSAVLRLEDAPEELINLCLESGRPLLQRTSAEHPSLAPERLRALSTHPHLAVRVGVAGNPRTPPEVLRGMCGDEPEVFVALSQNPSTPLDALESMFAGLALEQYFGAVPQLEQVMCTALASREDLTPSLAQRLAQRTGTAAALAQNPRTPPEIIDQLLSVELPKNAKVSEQLEYAASHAALAARSDLTPAQMARLLADPEERVRKALAQNPSTPPELLAALVEDERSEVRHTANQHPKLSSAVRERLVRAGSTPDLLRLGAAQELPAQELARLAGGGHWAQVLAACHPSTPPVTLEKLLGARSWEVRWALAKNPAAPRAILAALANDPDSRVRAEATPRVLGLAR